MINMIVVAAGDSSGGLPLLPLGVITAVVIWLMGMWHVAGRDAWQARRERRASGESRESQGPAVGGVVKIVVGLAAVGLLFFVPYRLSTAEYKLKCTYHKVTGQSIGFPDSALCSVFGV